MKRKNNIDNTDIKQDMAEMQNKLLKAFRKYRDEVLESSTLAS